MGVEIRLDTVIGKLFTIPQLVNGMGYQTAFVGPVRDRRNSPRFRRGV